jgi:hypothetical protein
MALIGLALVLAADAAWSQTETTLSGVGSVKTDVKRVGNTAAVTNQFTPAVGKQRACTGTCYYASGAVSINWTCTSDKACQLECSGAAPKGRC